MKEVREMRCRPCQHARLVAVCDRRVFINVGACVVAPKGGSFVFGGEASKRPEVSPFDKPPEPNARADSGAGIFGSSAKSTFPKIADWAFSIVFDYAMRRAKISSQSDDRASLLCRRVALSRYVFFGIVNFSRCRCTLFG